MNYRHGFHAGNVADVVKHLVLIEVLKSLQRKSTPFCVIDSHAGAGLYPLKPPGEFEHGVLKLWSARARLAQCSEYFALIDDVNRGGRLARYPGSPLIVARYLRPGDRAVFIEREPGEYHALRAALRGRPRITVNRADAWQALPGLLPPREQRGLVLIDPPFERADDFEHIGQALAAGLRRFRQGIYLAWFPIKDYAAASRALERLARTLAAPFAVLEFMTLPPDVRTRLNGSGLVLVNAPWKLDAWARAELPPIASYLAGAGGAPKVSWQERG